ncbi:glycosyltransferase [Hymenobacter sp.]|uniref:glycosyltransferase n=1 Tax=Hymenobacter sp. TaxID=1898978 RepID=UPI00286D3423|nr:glycosyltransferase [Hymenobacter sp.]
MTQGFTIVICTFNGTSRLAPTLTHVAALALPAGYAAELIVVDNASTDDTGTFVRALWQKLDAPFTLHLLREPRPGKGYAVETGYDAAQYSCILTVDDDNWLQADYLTTAVALLRQDPAIGVLQGHSSAVMELPPPAWFDQVKWYFIIGGPKPEIGYFASNDFYVWGAGMVIMRADWLRLRGLGFSALTSKLPGKAAGEDNEVAIGLILLGRKIYYSDQLCYKHYMPKERINWKKLQQNFDTFAYVSYYFFLYGVVVNSFKNQSAVTDAYILKEFGLFCVKYLRGFTVKHHVSYLLRPREDVYQLRLQQYYAMLKWFWKLRKQAKADITFIQGWLLPLLRSNPTFSWFC